MNDVLLNLIAPAVIALATGGGFWTYLQSRESKKAGVKEHDVTEKRDAGALALELAETLAKDRDKDRARLDEIERENVRLTGMLEHFQVVIGEVVHMLSEVVAWEQAGSPPPPPYRLSNILAQLLRLNRLNRNPPEE